MIHPLTSPLGLVAPVERSIRLVSLPSRGPCTSTVIVHQKLIALALVALRLGNRWLKPWGTYFSGGSNPVFGTLGSHSLNRSSHNGTMIPQWFGTIHSHSVDRNSEQQEIHSDPSVPDKAATCLKSTFHGSKTTYLVPFLGQQSPPILYSLLMSSQKV